MARKFPTLKRYCGAGAESSVAFVEELFSLSSCGNNGYNILYAILNYNNNIVPIFIQLFVIKCSISK